MFRLGLAPTIPAARQLISHGHVLVEGRRVDRPAYRVDTGQLVALSARARAMPAIAETAAQGPEVSGSVAREDIPFVVDPTAIVEFYAR